MQDRPIEGFSLSPPQKHLWEQRVDQERSPAAACRIGIEGALGTEELARALSAAVAEHEILRTGFAVLPGTHVPMQVIREPRQVAVEEHDLAALAPDARERRAVELLDELAARPFALDGEALRALLLRTGPERCELLLAQPALCTDDASLWNLARVLAESLAGEPLVAGDDEAEAMQYADLAEWQREMFESEEAPEGLGFWRRTDLSGLARARLALEHVADADEPFEPRRLALDVPDAVHQGAAALAARLGVAPEAVYRSAWHLLLARLAEDGRLVLGVASEGRAFEGLEHALGPFQKYLPVTLDPAAERFDALVERSAAALEAAREWHELWDLQRMPTAQGVGFLPYAFERRAVPEPLAAAGRTFTLLGRRPAGERFRACLVLDEGPRGASCALEYDARVLSDEAAACLADQYATLLAGACARPEAPAGELGSLSDAWARRLTAELAHDGASPEVSVERIDDLFAEHARARGDAPAVIAAGHTLSHAELDRRANRLARELAGLGVGRGSFVGIFMSRSADMIIAIVGVLRAGAAYLPLPPDYPAERVTFMLADASVAVVLTRAADAGALPPSDAQALSIDELADGDDGPFASPARGDDAAYVIYTSGSTGRPKGVPIAHANLLRSNAARAITYGAAPERYLLLSSFAFDSSVAGIFWTLAAGGALVLPEEGSETDVVALRELIRGQRVTHTLCLPSLWAVVLENSPAEELGSLDTVIVAGESCPKDLVEAHFAKLPGTRLFNEYGPTEGTVWSTVYDCSRPNQRPTVPIGQPVPGASVYVLDPELRPVPVGIAGELFLGGPGIARGYLARPELTAERFLANPFDQNGGAARLYRTGDLARFLSDGNLEFLGRVDHQVKIRGHRIELEEIDAVLNTLPGVGEAVVHAREDRPGDKRLVAYVTGQERDAAPLRAGLADSLPDYMVPAHFVFLDELPRLPNGKVDRKALPAPGEASASAAYQAPGTALEVVLCSVWSEVLGVERVGVHDDFFELGGHSILATQLFARIVDTLEVRISLRTLFDHRSVSELCARMCSDPAETRRLERSAEILLEVLAADDDETPG